jgi:hypothetical protein
MLLLPPCTLTFLHIITQGKLWVYMGDYSNAVYGKKQIDW